MILPSKKVFQGETRNYKGTDYTGLKAFGAASVHASVPQNSKVIRASGDLSASVFSGMNSYKNPTSVYVNADMNGGVKGSLHVPSGWPLIGGVKLGSTSFDFSLVQVRWYRSEERTLMAQ